MSAKGKLSQEDFLVLDRWIKAEAKLAMAERTYQNDRAIADVAMKARKAQKEGYAVLVCGESLPLKAGAHEVAL